MSDTTECALPLPCIREVLSGIVSRACPNRDVALLLSGGVDSLSLGFAAEDAGKNVSAYTFQVGEWDSPDSIAAERAAGIFGWDFTLVKVPVDNLVDDFLRLAKEFGCRRKTQYECTFPFLYLFPEIVESHILSGVAADGHYGLSRRSMTAVLGERDASKRREVFDGVRREYFFGDDNPAGIVQLRLLSDKHNKTLIDPYLQRAVFDYFIQLGWYDINRPQQKTPILRAYAEKFRTVGTRKHLNLQLASGIDKVFESLLYSGLNTKGRTRVMDLCRDYACDST